MLKSSFLTEVAWLELDAKDLPLRALNRQWQNLWHTPKTRLELARSMRQWSLLNLQVQQVQGSMMNKEQILDLLIEIGKTLAAVFFILTLLTLLWTL